MCLRVFYDVEKTGAGVSHRAGVRRLITKSRQECVPFRLLFIWAVPRRWESQVCIMTRSYTFKLWHLPCSVEIFGDLLNVPGGFQVPVDCECDLHFQLPNITNLGAPISHVNDFIQRLDKRFLHECTATNKMLGAGVHSCQMAPEPNFSSRNLGQLPQEQFRRGIQHTGLCRKD